MAIHRIPTTDVTYTHKSNPHHETRHWPYHQPFLIEHGAKLRVTHSITHVHRINILLCTVRYKIVNSMYISARRLFYGWENPFFAANLKLNLVESACQKSGIAPNYYIHNSARRHMYDDDNTDSMCCLKSISFDTSRWLSYAFHHIIHNEKYMW